jgi:hypothetical protein
MLEDLRTCTELAKKLPCGEIGSKIRTAFADFDPDDFDDSVVQGLLAMVGVEGGVLPGRMAEINEALDALPVPLRERLLVEYLNDLFRPSQG